MKLKDLGLTKQDIKDKVSKYMIDTYERQMCIRDRHTSVLISWQRQPRACTCTMKMELRIWISMQVSR